MPYDSSGTLVLPSKIYKEFEPWMLQAMLEAGIQGGTLNELILSTGLTKRLFKGYHTPGSPSYNEDFDDAFQMASMRSQAFWESIGRFASEGKIPTHKAGTFKFMLQNNFRDSYRDEQIHKIETTEIPSISADLDPIDASKRYKQLLLESSLGDFFD
jgi:hypothetical protein